MASVNAPRHMKAPKHAQRDASGAVGESASGRVSAHAKHSAHASAVPSSRRKVVFAGAVLAAVAVIAVSVAMRIPPSAFVPASSQKEAELPAAVDLSTAAFAVDAQPLSDEERALLSAVSVNGTALTEEAMEQISSHDVSYASQMGQLLQNDLGLPSGCEIVSLALLLQSLGYDASPHVLADDFLVMDGNFSSGYAGSPYGAGGGFPPGIVHAANAYLLAQGADQRAYDLTGSTLSGLEGLVKHGYPVLVWSTMYFEEPSFSGSFENGREWYNNEHCIVVYGMDGDTVSVSDPLEGLVMRPRADFERIYNSCGCMSAVVI